MLVDVVSGIVDDISYGEGTVCEPRRKFNGELGSDKIVSDMSIVADGAILEDVLSELFELFGFASDERVASTFVRLLSSLCFSKPKFL